MRTISVDQTIVFPQICENRRNILIMFLRRIIEWINSLEAGHQFRKWASFYVKISGVFILIATFVLSILFLVLALMYTRTSSIGTQAFTIIGTVIGLVIIGIVGITLTMLFWNRAKKIVSVGEETHLIFGPIARIVIHLSGEAIFIGFIRGGLLCFVCSNLRCRHVRMVCPHFAHFFFPLSSFRS